MKLKIHNRAPSRIALAGLLAVISCSSFAQQTPGTVAAAQAQSQGAGPAPRPATPPKSPNGFAPSAQPPAYPGAPGGAGVPMQAEGRLKPKVILPTEALTDEQGAPGGQAYGGGGSSYAGPGAPPRSAYAPQSGGFNSPRGGPSAPSRALPAGPNDNPFSPAGAMPMPGPSQGAAATPPAGKSAPERAKKPKEPVEDGPTINLQCTTPDIKEQGVFVGKIQNRYVYKYKSQYCFDVKP